MSSEEDMGRLLEKVDQLEDKVRRQGEKIDTLLAFQRWVLGGAAVIGVMLGFFMDLIKKRLGIS